VPFGGFHWPELVVILLVGLIFFGPKRLPEIGGAIGRSITEFRKTTSGKGEDDNKSDVRLEDRVEKIDPKPVERDIRDVRDTGASSAAPGRDAS
jgi:sec-independent protein translocase protein TatA